MVLESEKVINSLLTSAAQNYWLEKVDQRHEGLLSTNFLLQWDKVPQGDYLSSDDSAVKEVISSFRRQGFIPFSEANIFYGLAYLITNQKLRIPYEGHYKRTDEIIDKPELRRTVQKERATFFEDLMGVLHYEKAENCVEIWLAEDNKEMNITDIISVQAVGLRDLVRNLETYDAFKGKITKFTKAFVKANSGLLVFVANNRPDNRSPLVTIDSEDSGSSTIKANSDVITPADSVARVAYRELVNFNQLVCKRKKLKRAYESGEIKVVPAFTRDNWPNHPLIQALKPAVEEVVQNYMQKNGIICDPLDAQYQVLFRLTTYPVPQVFCEANYLDEFLRHSDSGRTDWRKLLSLDSDDLAGLEIRADLLRDTVIEQMSIVEDTISRSSLPLKDFIVKRGIFNENGWELKKSEGKVIAIKKTVQGGPVVNTIGVDFKVVDPALAVQIHRDLHYIHTPRCEKAFGFFLPGEQLPFSVLALEKVDRPYKQNTLLMFGYDPRYCWDFTRLYSRPGVPKNASSAMFGEAFAYLKQEDPRIQAAVSAFMPSYASGLSMLTGGFETPILLKPGRHSFVPVETSSGLAWEHVTKRRQVDQNPTFLMKSRFPLLPVVELIAPINNPRFDPILKLGRDMVEIE